jgi:hypothetical protein
MPPSRYCPTSAGFSTEQRQCHTTPSMTPSPSARASSAAPMRRPATAGPNRLGVTRFKARRPHLHLEDQGFGDDPHLRVGHRMRRIATTSYQSLWHECGTPAASSLRTPRSLTRGSTTTGGTSRFFGRNSAGYEACPSWPATHKPIGSETHCSRRRPFSVIPNRELGRWSFRAVQVAIPLQFKFALPRNHRVRRADAAVPIRDRSVPPRSLTSGGINAPLGPRSNRLGRGG